MAEKILPSVSFVAKGDGLNYLINLFLILKWTRRDFHMPNELLSITLNPKPLPFNEALPRARAALCG